jgi:hypothetical protein
MERAIPSVSSSIRNNVAKSLDLFGLANAVHVYEKSSKPVAFGASGAFLNPNGSSPGSAGEAAKV